MKQSSDYKFQISLDTDSILISQAPNTPKSRVILANLEKEQLQQLAQSILDANLEDEFVEALNSKKELMNSGRELVES